MENEDHKKPVVCSISLHSQSSPVDIMGNKPPGGQKPPPEGGSGGNGNNNGGNSKPPPKPPQSGGGKGSCGPCSPTTDSSDPQPTGDDHPLNQLSPAEIRRTVEIIKQRATKEGIRGDLVFASVSMLEPKKKELLLYFGGGAKPQRRAWAVFSEEGLSSAYETNINLTTGAVETFVKLPPGTQPSFNTDDPLIAQDIIRADSRVIERANRAGVTNMDLLICDAWSYGYNDTSVDRQNKRLMDMYLYAQKYDGDNQYAHPLDFLVTVDMISRQVTDIVNLPICPENEPQAAERPVPPPQESHNYDPRVLPQDYFRSDVKQLDVTQPNGPSFTLNGNRISWQKWDMIIGFNFREGLTFHNISMSDKGKKRGVLYRAALSEMVVPYGDPRSPYYRKSAFDLGEYGLGYCANSLTNGCDCLGEIRYMDAVFANAAGDPFVTKNAICIHEEDAGLLQKHTEFRNGNVTIARSRKLVVSFIATVTNYDYAFYWNFFQDGTMHVDVKATGLLSTHSLGQRPECSPGGYGVIMAPRINAPYHQHIFCARLDTNIDGPNNSVTIQEVVPLEASGTTNPYGQGFKTRTKTLDKAGDSGTDTNPDLTRTWLVQNENVTHPYTRLPVAWKLVAPGFSRILAGPMSGVYRRAGFARHNVWVTPYKEGQLYAAGKYINQARGGTDGVDVWAAENGNIRNTDIVLWHTFGLTHIPRVEDFPLMPIEGAYFTFRPSNFFNANPALDVPAPKKKTCT